MTTERLSNSPARELPSVDRLLRQPGVDLLSERYSRVVVVENARELLGEWRERARAGEACSVPAEPALAEELAARIKRSVRPALRRAINATGVILHTNLGRAPLAPSALQAMAAVGQGYSNLEYDLEAGERGSRHELVSSALERLTGAEASLVVNNNAAAVLLVLSALALDREVIISRGQLVEIGGGFRVPDVLRQSGARLVEVGTTNKTYPADYRAAVGTETALLLRVHSSNFKVIGFVQETSMAELAEVAHGAELPLVDDLGSGSLLDTSQFGLAREPMVQESITQGADLVCFSGDKLIGGPQSGIIVGKAGLVAQLKRHPLTRAIRPDKLTLAALGATLDHYVRAEAVERVPIWRMIATTPEAIEQRGRILARRLGGAPATFQLVDGVSAIGGGSLPGEILPTRLLGIEHAPGAESAGRTVSPDELAARLRTADPPVIGRIERNRLVLDLRTVLPEEDDLLADTLASSL